MRNKYTVKKLNNIDGGMYIIKKRNSDDLGYVFGKDEANYFRKKLNFNKKKLIYDIMTLIMNDSFACSFQSLGQYRSALVKEINKF